MQRACAVIPPMLASILVIAAAPAAPARSPVLRQPEGEPGLAELLERRWGLHVDRDLRNTPREDGATSCVFRQVDSRQPVTFQPLISLGSEKTTSGGWYPTPPRCDQLPVNLDDGKRERIWSFAYRAPREKSYFGGPAPRLLSGETTFHPGPGTFSLWIAGEQDAEVVVHLHPALNSSVPRLRDDPYRARIYPNRHPRTGEFVQHSYLIAWDYTGEGYFQDLVAQIDNVELLPAQPVLPGILSRNARVKSVAGAFKTTDGPAWSHLNPAIYFTDTGQSRILRYAADRVTISTSYSHGARGLMFDDRGRLLACERQGRRISRTTPSGISTTVVAEYRGTPLSGPCDLWLDQHQGVYFTNATDGPSDLSPDQEQAVYYVGPGATDGAVLVVGGLGKPSGIALSPDGRMLYVVDAGRQQLLRFRVVAPGNVSSAELIAHVSEPAGMTIDEEGRLFVAGRGGIWVLDRHGEWMGIIETLEKPTNCTFGGTGRKTLFITAGTSLYSIETRTSGWHVHVNGVSTRHHFDWDLTASSR